MVLCLLVEKLYFKTHVSQRLNSVVIKDHVCTGTTLALVLDNREEVISHNTTVNGSITTHHNFIHNNRIIIQVRGAVF